MNILFIAEYYFANPDFVQLTKELAKKKHNISVATSLRTTDEKTKEKDVEIFEIKPLATIYKIPHTLSLPLSRLRQVVKKQKIHVVHAINDYSTNVATAAMVAKATSKPFVYTIQGLGTRTGHLLVDSLANLYDLTVERWIAEEARRVILLSKSLISRAEKLRIKRRKVVIIPSGVDSTRYNPERPNVKKKALQLKDEFDIDNDIVVGFVGRLVPAKGLSYLFSAVEKVQEKHNNIAILIVGNGAQRSELEFVAQDLKVRTIFAGWQRDVLPYYALMDIFVLPSLFEGLPNVILEAMAMKTAIIATNVGGNTDILVNGENGFLVPVRNVQKLTYTLEKLIEDDSLRVEMGIINRRKIEERFQWSKTVEKIEKVYNEIA